MRRRDFISGLLALGVTAVVADKLAFVRGLGRVFPSAATYDQRLVGLIDITTSTTVHGLNSSVASSWLVAYDDVGNTRWALR